MSHITTIKTQLYDREVLLEALQSLNLRVTEGGSIGDGRTVDLVVSGKEGSGWGFKKWETEGAYQVEGLKMVLNREDIKKLLARITQEYARLKVIKETRAKGFALVRQVRMEQGTIKLVLKKVAAGGGQF